MELVGISLPPRRPSVERRSRATPAKPGAGMASRTWVRSPSAVPSSCREGTRLATAIASVSLSLLPLQRDRGPGNCPAQTRPVHRRDDIDCQRFGDDAELHVQKLLSCRSPGGALGAQPKPAPRQLGVASPRGDWAPVDRVCAMAQAGRIQVLGAFNAQYAGTRLDDPGLDPYFALSEEPKMPSVCSRCVTSRFQVMRRVRLPARRVCRGTKLERHEKRSYKAANSSETKAPLVGDLGQYEA